MDLIIVAMTGWGQDEDRRRSAQAGFDGHLVKPVDYSVLLALLGALLEQRALTASLVRSTVAQISAYSP
jgi:DNA-binding response OmpR family regulator